ncbi:MAG: hypothetical protein FWE80_01650 [Oscillospiraceae bacterium]|nr:hypothetical protein [Oscillospiraceae bacterium]
MGVAAIIFGIVCFFLGLGFLAARYRFLPGAAVAAGLICWLPVTVMFLDYHGPHSALSAAFWALTIALPAGAAAVALVLLGYYAIGKQIKRWFRPDYPGRRPGIILVLAAAAVMPLYIAADCIQPSPKTQAGYYAMLLFRQPQVIENGENEYEINAGGRMLYLRTAAGETDGYTAVRGDLYGVPDAAPYDEPLAVFPRTAQGEAPDIRGMFLEDKVLYYNYGPDETRLRSAFNKDMIRLYAVRDFQFGKIDLTTMKDTKIEKAEYEQAYLRVLVSLELLDTNESSQWSVISG